MTEVRALLAATAAGAICLLVLASSAAAGSRHDCGNPPNFSGRLTAINYGCAGARQVFESIQCSDSKCDEIHSGAWQCYRRTISRYKGRGNCTLGRARVRWVVYE